MGGELTQPGETKAEAPGMRVYFPATLAMLMTLEESGEFRPLSGTGFALTPALRESFTAGDDDELTEVAVREAARASLRLLGAHAHDTPNSSTTQTGDTQTGDTQTGDEPPTPLPPRRAVVAADVSEVTLHPELDDAVVRVKGPIPRSAVASVLVDGADAEPLVLAAVTVIDAADLGDEDAELAVGDVEDHDLGWYATQELPFLLELL